MKTEEFEYMAKKRNGVESIPSVMRRKYNIDKIPVRGMLRTELFFGFKIAAVNFAKFCKNFIAQDQCAQNMASA